MDNAEQNRRLLEAVERIMAAREQAAPMMNEVFTHGVDVVFLKGRKRERKVGMVLSFDSEANTLIVKHGRSNTEEILLEAVVEIVEPLFATLKDDEPEDASDGDSDTPF